jgi:hypothetical protein
VLHRRELRDVCALLSELGVPYEERRTTGPGCDGDPWRLVVATPQRVLELRASGVGDGASVLAVCDGFSKTLAAKLAQARVHYVLRRPAHPAALRLLLLHALYRGPEKRRFRRVSVGAPVGLRLGWRRRPAMLLELSTSGCRLQTDRAGRAGARVTISVPASLAGLRRPLRLRGRVVRSTGARDGDGGAAHEVAVEFGSLGNAAAAAVAELVHAHGRGPASWKDAPRAAGAEPADEDASAGETTLRPMRDPDAPDRRRSPRLRYAKPVLVKGDGASRVLMGRDLSTGGMRVMRDRTLAVGERLKLALYGQDGIPPLMLQAEVAREDGPFLVLRFDDPGDAALDQLHRIMTSLPLSGADEAGRATPLVVSEIVDRG